MNRPSPDATETEHRDVVAALRHLSNSVEVPPGLLDRVKEQESYLRYVWQEDDTTSAFEHFLEWLRLAWTTPAMVKVAALSVIMTGVVVGMVLGALLYSSWHSPGRSEPREQFAQGLEAPLGPPIAASRSHGLTPEVLSSHSEEEVRLYREWQQVQKSSQPALLAKFAALYPDGPYTPAVQRRLERLQQGPCLSVRTESPRVMPLSLLNSMESRDDLYWFYVHIGNQCVNPLHLSIRVDVRKGPARLPHDQRDVQFTVLPGESRSERIEPLLDWTSSDADTTLELVWEIRNMTDGALEHTETARIRLRPKTWFAWELSSPSGDPVSREFLLAALAAWVRNPLPSAAHDCHQVVGEAKPGAERLKVATAWLQHCYNRLFHQAPAVRLIPEAGRFPPAAGQVIRSPAQILTERNATPLEAVLLLSSLAQEMAQPLGIRLALFVLPRATEPEPHQTAILAWRMIGSTHWQALDLQRATTLSFTENARLTFETVAAWMRQQPDAMHALDKFGVFLQEQPALVALDFAQAARTFSIRGLP
ncbi:MAG: hypothetical protein ETSY1_15335 [Candidatus Entotheonella factor]|uniref:Uncharacterized protein n=1 Tax=Entotheonella factor TaxID=1429438 RepID=W4LMQ4_ENTF1|nr:MAG: hypothetical protein ETSY1_15335 [Candidatus Entotheonella factor]